MTITSIINIAIILFIVFFAPQIILFGIGKGPSCSFVLSLYHIPGPFSTPWAVNMYALYIYSYNVYFLCKFTKKYCFFAIFCLDFTYLCVYNGVHIHLFVYLI